MEPAATGMSAIIDQISNLTTVVGNVFSMITSNALLAYFAAVGVVIAAIRIFKKLKKGAR